MLLDIQRDGTVRLGPADERDFAYEERKKKKKLHNSIICA